MLFSFNYICEAKNVGVHAQVIQIEINGKNMYRLISFDGQCVVSFGSVNTSGISHGGGIFKEVTAA